MPNFTPPPDKITPSGIHTSTLTGTRVIPQSRRPDGTVRKERKVRDGYTPAEDVEKYRVRVGAGGVSGGGGGASPAPGLAVHSNGQSSSVPGAVGLTRGFDAVSLGDARVHSGGGGGGLGAITRWEQGVPGFVAGGEDASPSRLSKNQKKNERKKMAKKKKKTGESWDGAEDDREGDLPEAPQSSTSQSTSSTLTSGKISSATAPAPVEEDTTMSSSSSQQGIEKRIKALRKKLRQTEALKVRQDQGAQLDAEQAEKVARMAELSRELEDLLLS